MEEGKIYSFEALEKALNEFEKFGICLHVRNVKQNETAIMHVFHENFCSPWLSGDGVLFYNDGETHSAESYEEFELLKIIKF
jgi:hypothetical protein